MKKRIKEILAKFEGQEIRKKAHSANFFGQESKGRGQWRGNGVLILTTEELFFEMWLPKRILRIPLSSIQKIETVKAHLGKTRFKPLLKVVFTNEAGEQDSGAWLVRDLQDWIVTLNLIITRK